MSVDSNFILKLLETKDWKTVAEKRISAKFFNPALKLNMEIFLARNH